MNRIDLRPEWVDTIERLIAGHLPDAEVMVYGSRVSGTAHEGSDLDIVVRNPSAPDKPFDNLPALREAISGSSLPILVDVLDWAKIPEGFRAEIEMRHEVLRNCYTPVFQDIPDSIDETWRHGALIGAMAELQTNIDIARAYKIAGDILVARNAKEAEAYEFVYPLLFLYRHSIELYLKSLPLGGKYSHDITKLIPAFEEFVLNEYKQAVPPRVKSWMLEFAMMDPNSTTFRYIHDRSEPKHRLKNTEQLDKGEWWVDLNNLKSVMDYLSGIFEKIILNMTII
ncbi:MAG: nucleotidyltransferase domain-containing protein [Nitrospirae bacterium]|nr:nucleotidyltransferase domain-containing protein [Nitrospirota bacterium]